MIKPVLLTFTLALSLMSITTVQAEVQVDRDYWVIKNTDSNSEANVQANYFFTWMGCASCTMVMDGLGSDLENIEIVPLIARPEWRPAAKIFYVIQLLEMDKTLLRDLINDIEAQKIDPTNLEQMRSWLLEKEADKEQLDKILDDEALFAKVAYARELAEKYNIQYAPTVVIKGQYATDARHTMKVEKFSEVVRYLKSL